MILGSTLHYTSLLALINVYLFHWNGRHSSRPWPQCAFTLPSHFWYARRYHFVFSPDTHDKVSFADLPVTPNALPDNFVSDFLALENWPSAATLLTKPNNTICWPDNASLRMWLPDVSDRSPHHGITICCGSAGDRARSHGPTLGYRDIHQESADRQGAVWNSYFSHVPQYESLASVFYSSMEYWVGYTADAIPRSTIDPILASYKELTPTTRLGCMPGVYLLTHSLTTSTPTSSPCTLLTLCSSKALVQGPTALLWQR